MRKMLAANCGLIMTGSLLLNGTAWASGTPESADIEALVNDTIAPLMAEHRIPGMAIALSINGQQHYFNYGLANQEAGIPVTDETLFELGSISKIFTAALTGYAQASGALSLSDPASHYLTELEGSAFDEITLLELGTYTAGELPLQFPESVQSEETMIDYYRQWQPESAPGSHRLYSNPSLGLFGYLAAQSLGQPFEMAMEEALFAPLGLEHSYFQVPEAQQANYAYGYSKEDEPIRVNPGMLDAQAYGLKSTAADVLTLVEANMSGAELNEPLSQALAATRTGYFEVGNMTQGLGWESYAYPVALDQLLVGNSLEMILQPNPANRLTPPLAPRQEALYNKTGATNGFGGYVAFVPSEQIGIVLLANRNYPNQARIEAAQHILTKLTEAP
ncbi:MULTISPECIES: class C beta-lactamase [unclassified Halomonas]|uniref:class C beta-lactamase n=1 Tax=unclassified Halomonas TaxID=2609666 RepID=UPI0004AC9A44|nr:MULTISPECIES: class C beta-lactamase [unclassified Halomonas]NAO97763.1 class C beta-lactamase [Halomonas sp. MG34]PKH62663.1 class C beta-lactamase [Halomonas sp. Choline-3u-9]QGQ69114.1 beta-lactamase [Halomonas sp. PA16-9]